MNGWLPPARGAAPLAGAAGWPPGRHRPLGEFAIEGRVDLDGAPLPQDVDLGCGGPAGGLRAGARRRAGVGELGVAGVE